MQNEARQFRSWAEVSSSEKFLSLSPEHQERARELYYQDTVAPRVPKGMEQRAREMFDRDTMIISQDIDLEAQDQESNQSDGKSIITDAGNLLVGGINRAAQNVRELVGRIPVAGEGILNAGDAVDSFFHGKDSETLLRENEKRYQGNLTQETQDAQAKLWWDSESKSLGPAWKDPRAYASGIIQSLPEMVLTMGPSGRLAKAAYTRSLAKTGSKVMAAKAAAKTATIAGGIGEGLLGGADTARSVRDKINEMPLEKLANSEAFQSLIDEGMKPEEARRNLAEDSATQGMIIAGVATGIFGGLGDRALAKMLTGSIKSGVAGRITKGAVSEGIFEELPQSISQSMAENYAVQAADPTQELTDGVLNEGLGGLATGGVMGGGLGAIATPRVNQESSPEPTNELESQEDATFENTPEPLAIEAPGLQGLLPEPEQTFYADSEGVVQDIGPVRNVDGVMRPAQQDRKWVSERPEQEPPMKGGAGMDRQAPTAPPKQRTPAPKATPEEKSPQERARYSWDSMNTFERNKAAQDTLGYADADMTEAAAKAWDQLAAQDQQKLADAMDQDSGQRWDVPNQKISDKDRPVLQNRDRSTDASIAQMQDIKNNPDYDRLSVSRDFGNGAPVVEPGADFPATQLGRSERTTTSTGRKIPVQYAVVEADQLLPSNDALGNSIPEYANGVEGKSRAIAGNGRVAGITAAWKSSKPDKAEAYKKQMIEDTQHGIDPKVIRAMKQPVLVRIMPLEEVSNNIGDESNVSGQAGLSPTEQANTDMRRIDLAELSLTEDNELSENTVLDFIKGMPKSELGTLLTKSGRPTPAAYARAEAALFQQAYQNEALTENLVDLKGDAKFIMNALMRAAPAMAKLEGAGIYDIRPLVSEAAEVAVNARRQGIRLSEFIKMGDFGRNPQVMPILEMMIESGQRTTAIGDKLINLAQMAYTEANKAGQDMFGEVDKQSPEALMKKAFDGEKANAQEIDGTPEALGDDGRSRPDASNAEGRAADGEGQPDSGAVQADQPAKPETAEAKLKKKAAEKKASTEPTTEKWRKNYLLAKKRATELGLDPKEHGKLPGLVKAIDAAIAEKARPEAPALDLAQQTEESLAKDAERLEQLQKEEAAQKATQKAAESKQRERDADKARADEVVDDFQLGQSAEEAMSGMGDIFDTSPSADKPEATSAATTQDIGGDAPSATRQPADAGETFERGGREWSAEARPGKGLIKGKFIPYLNGKSTPGGPFDTAEAAIEHAKSYAGRVLEGEANAQRDQARMKAVRGKVERGEELSKPDLDFLNLREGSSDLRWFIPNAARLFGLTSRKVRPLVSDLIRVSHNDMGTKFESVPTNRALQQMANALRDEAAPSAASAGAETKAKDAGAQAAQPAPAPIEDAGEKLGGARKDELRTVRERLDDMSDEAIASSKLSELWPRGEVDRITDPFHAAAYHAVRAHIPTKPRATYRVKRWVDQVKAARGLLQDLADIGADASVAKMRETSPSLNILADQIELLMGIDRAHWSRVSDAKIRNGRYSQDGEMVPGSWVELKIDKRGKSFYGHESIASALPAINQSLDSKPVAEKKQKFSIYTRTATGEVFISADADKERRALKLFESTGEARKYLDDHHGDLVAAWEAVKNRENVTRGDMRRSVNETRVGQDYRGGKDVTPEQFLDQFGFRGVEFGNWVKQGKGGQERQGILNDAYDAFMDLAGVVGVPPKALSLEGRLGIGFGSRGAGRASAHFESDRTVINLTKTKGAGALAHEWFHAMDNYFAHKRGVDAFTGDNDAYRKGAFVTYRPEPMMVRKDTVGKRYRLALTRAELALRRARSPDDPQLAADAWVTDPEHKQGVRPVVEKAFAELVQTLDASPMTRRSSIIDKGKVDGYWSQIIERGARAFETYVIARLADQGARNDYLANVQTLEEFSRDPGRYPYLTPDEQGPVNEAFDKLFNTIESRETDSGVQLYKANKKDGATGVKADAITDALASTPELAGVKVVQSFEDLPEQARKQAEIDGVDAGDISGIYFNGTSYVVADSHATIADAVRTAVHEEVGHRGIRGLLGDKLAPTMERIYSSMAATAAGRKLIKDIRADYGHLRDNDQRQAVAEELVAHLLETGDKPSLVQRFVSKVRQLLRAMFPQVKWTNLDVLALGEQSRAWLRRDMRPEKSATGNAGTFSADTDDIRFSFAGQRSETADHYSLGSAQQRIESGENAEAVRQDTGWHRGVDGKWRYEISDAEAKLKKPFPTKGQPWGDVYKSVNENKVSQKKDYGLTLGEVIDHPALFAAYPDLAGLSIGTQKGSGAKYSAGGGVGPATITVGEDVPMSDLIKKIMHEVQHGIQFVEGFAVGGPGGARMWMGDYRPLAVNEYKKIIADIKKPKSLDEYSKIAWGLDQPTPEVFEAYTNDYLPTFESMKLSSKVEQDAQITAGWNAYMNLYGEVEARNTEARLGMNADQRRATPPEATQDTADSEAVVVFNGQEMLNAPAPVNTGTNPDIRYSLKGKKNKHTSESFSDLTDKQKAALNKIAPLTTQQKAAEWFRDKTDRALLKIRQGLVDRFAALRELDEAAHGEDILNTDITSSSWVLARMSSAASGALHAMLNNGRIYLDQKQKVIDIQEGDSLGLGATLARLGSPAEIERFMGWIAGNRSARLAAEGRENLFSADDIDALKTLNEGKTESGKARKALYDDVFKEFQQYRDDVLAIAEQTGIITAENRALWRDEFYVPFYRVMDEEAKVGGPGGTKGLTRQEAYKKLKGGKQNLNDLLQNTMLNFNHLLTASLKNQAAAQALSNAEKVGVAEKTTEAARDKKASTFVLVDGQQQWYNIDDPLVFEALSMISDGGLNTSAVKVMSFFKRTFTNMTTITPQFIIANLLRDSMQATATSPVSKNFLKNIAAGGKDWTDSKKRARMMATGGAFSFGHIYNNDPHEMKAHLTRNLKSAQLLSSTKLIPTALRAGWDAWNATANAAENTNRAAIFSQNEKSKGKLAAAFEARDLMDFSMSGAWPAVRFLIRVIPFLNARLQGLDKLHRSGVKPTLLTAFGKGNASDKQAAKRFLSVVGAISAASMALMLVNNDDEEYRKLEEWQKDTYWFVRLGDKAFFIPKPFEVGVIATMAERMLQQGIDDKATGELFRRRLGHAITETFAFSVVPHAFQPVLDVYSNMDAFTERPIESMGMERLSKGLRARANTTAPARALSSATRVFGDDFPLAVSPVQADHLIKGYLGQVGAWGAGLADTMWRAAKGETQPARHWHEYQPIRRFYKDLDTPNAYTRYSTLFYEGLRESGKVYADVMELQKLGKEDQMRETINKNRDILGMRKNLNRAQRDLSKINARIGMIRIGGLDAEEKRREIDRLTVIKSRITEAAGKQVEAMKAAR